MKKVKHYTKRQIENLIKEQILKECISEQFEGHLENNLLLVEEGIIDSINIFRLISILEKKFDFIFDQQELLLENFETLNAINNCVINKIKKLDRVVEY